MGRDTHKTLFEGVVTFEGTMQALRAEKRVKATGVACRLVPTPRELSSTCALALSFAHADAESAGIEVEPRSAEDSAEATNSIDVQPQVEADVVDAALKAFVAVEFPKCGHFAEIVRTKMACVDL